MLIMCPDAAVCTSAAAAAVTGVVDISGGFAWKFGAAAAKIDNAEKSCPGCGGFTCLLLLYIHEMIPRILRNCLQVIFFGSLHIKDGSTQSKYKYFVLRVPFEYKSLLHYQIHGQ